MKFIKETKQYVSGNIVTSIFLLMSFSSPLIAQVTHEINELDSENNFVVRGDSLSITSGSQASSLKIRFDDLANRGTFWLSNSGEWTWSHGVTPTDVMSLDSNQVLSLYDLGASSIHPAITLNPGNPDATPVIPPTIKIGGSPVVTASNGAELLSSTFITRDANNQGSPSSLLMEGGNESFGNIPTQGDGVRMMWYPQKVAFRAGQITNDEWDDGNIGHFSAAYGCNTIASGLGSTAWGVVNKATAYLSTVWGFMNVVSGDYSTAWGVNNTSKSKLITVMGSQNIGEVISDDSRSCWYEVDPLLEVGNGDADASTMRSNALTILKNGQTTLTNKAWKSKVANGGGATVDIVANTQEVPDENEADIVDPSEYYSRGNALVVEGHTVLKGRVTLSEPQGDISMGTYQ